MEIDECTIQKSISCSYDHTNIPVRYKMQQTNIVESRESSEYVTMIHLPIERKFGLTDS